MLSCIGDVTADLGHGPVVDQRSDLHLWAEPVAHAQLFYTGGETFSERVIHARLHEYAIGADAGLAGSPELRMHRTFHGGIEISVVEHDERRIAAQFEAQLHDLVGCLTH